MGYKGSSSDFPEDRIFNIHEIVKAKANFGYGSTYFGEDGYMHTEESMCRLCYDILVREYGIAQIDGLEFKIKILKPGKYFKHYSLP